MELERFFRLGAADACLGWHVRVLLCNQVYFHTGVEVKQTWIWTISNHTRRCLETHIPCPRCGLRSAATSLTAAAAEQMNDLFAQMQTSAPGSGQPASCPETSQVLGQSLLTLPPLSQQQQQQQAYDLFAQLQASAPGSGQPARCPEISQVPIQSLSWASFSRPRPRLARMGCPLGLGGFSRRPTCWQETLQRNRHLQLLRVLPSRACRLLLQVAIAGFM